LSRPMESGGLASRKVPPPMLEESDRCGSGRRTSGRGAVGRGGSTRSVRSSSAATPAPVDPGDPAEECELDGAPESEPPCLGPPDPEPADPGRVWPAAWLPPPDAEPDPEPDVEMTWVADSSGPRFPVTCSPPGCRPGTVHPDHPYAHHLWAGPRPSQVSHRPLHRPRCFVRWQRPRRLPARRQR
jgi:hypothetical protein